MATPVDIEEEDSNFKPHCCLVGTLFGKGYEKEILTPNPHAAFQGMSCQTRARRRKMLTPKSASPWYARRASTNVWPISLPSVAPKPAISQALPEFTAHCVWLTNVCCHDYTHRLNRAGNFPWTRISLSARNPKSPWRSGSADGDSLRRLGVSRLNPAYVATLIWWLSSWGTREVIKSFGPITTTGQPYLRLHCPPLGYGKGFRKWGLQIACHLPTWLVNRDRWVSHKAVVTQNLLSEEG